MKKQTVFLTAIVLSAAMTACAPQADAPGTLPASTDAVLLSFSRCPLLKRLTSRQRPPQHRNTAQR
jgi:hypothetical protein